MTDYSRNMATELAVVRVHADRYEPDLVGHRVTELTRVEAAA